MKKERRLKQTLELYTVHNKHNTRDKHTEKGGTMYNTDDLTASLINYAFCILGKGLALHMSQHIPTIFLNSSLKFTLIEEFPSVKRFNTNMLSQQKHIRM